MAEETNNEILINYETLYDILRKERNSHELQELDHNFIHNLLEYLNNKLALLEDSKNKQDIFSSSERVETKTQIDNINKMIRDLLELREKKIIMMALNKSRTSSDIIDTTPLLEEEQKLFNGLVETMNWFREGFIKKINLGEKPALKSTVSLTSTGPEKEADETPETENKQNGTLLIRFLKPVPKFVGKELEVYGPFEEEDVANLPKELANVLINKGRAEAMED